MKSKILDLLKNQYPSPKISLNFNNTLELLVATILSAQCTDKQVNIVTKLLFKKYKTVNDYATADL
ncbi:MAG: endonuclease III, partial [Candidatus Omnitrophica bacterium]|nr:endonuclease III [Candidatus Omnitrophota bacterium]